MQCSDFYLCFLITTGFKSLIVAPPSLFVAPVESDVHPKPPAKARRSASPPRSAIRRAPYVNVRDRAALSRRSRLLEMQERSRRPISRTLETALTTDTTSSGIAAAAEYIRNGFVTSDDLARPDMTERERWLEEREARRVAGLEALQRNRERRNREEGNREEDNNTHQDSRTQWWMVHPHAQSRRENVVSIQVLLTCGNMSYPRTVQPFQNTQY